MSRDTTARTAGHLAFAPGSSSVFLASAAEDARGVRPR
jgi:hypothetical protein